MENAKSKPSAKVYKFVWECPINLLIKHQRSVSISAYGKKQASRMFERLIGIIVGCEAKLLEIKIVNKNKMNAYMFSDEYIKNEIEFLGLQNDGD